MTDAATFAVADKAFVIAPAGCGKTQLIAESVYSDSKHRSLILTHTYAGVAALRKRLEGLKANTSTYKVNTIAGWSLQLSISFPKTSGIKTKTPDNDQWDAVYRATSRMLSIDAIKTVIHASFDSVYVDEYQDCSPLQHEIILKLKEIIPTRIVGDPLQGIFDFGCSEIVDWPTHVKPHFDELPSLTTPHRWIKKNSALGDWLLGVREQLESHLPIDLRKAPHGSIKFIQLPSDPHKVWDKQRETCMSATCKNRETLLSIYSWESQCHKIARQSGGKFKSPETIECEMLFKTAKKIDAASDNITLAKATYDFACLCLTKTTTDLKRIVTKIFDGRGLQCRTYKCQEQLNSLTEIISSGSLASVRKALESFAVRPGAVKARYELFDEMLKALKEYETGQHSCLEDAAIAIREQTRRRGRFPGRYVVSRTFLVKGLEFDHAIVLDVNSLDRKNLYVALTRASRSLTILGTSPILNPD